MEQTDVSESEDNAFKRYMLDTAHQLGDQNNDSLEKWFSVTFQSRKQKMCEVINKFTTKIPVYILTEHPLYMENPRFLFPRYFQMGQVLYILKRKLSNIPDKSQALSIRTVSNHILKGNESIGMYHSKYKTKDECLYLVFANERVLG